MDRQTLESLVYENLSTYEIAARLDCSQTNVRYHLTKFGLRTTKGLYNRNLDRVIGEENQGTCGYCSKEFKSHHKQPFCSSACSDDHQRNHWIAPWMAGEFSPSERQVRRYLMRIHDYKCSWCKWGEINPSTGLTPLEIDHIDGNATNNTPTNVRLLCPNCHALTPTYRALNKGNGRRKKSR